MTRMTAAEAAVHVLKKEGIDIAFGVPGAAINPFYSAMRKVGGVDHVLARHVEGASHMAEGYTRTKAGNIGVCIGTSGPAGTDMITGAVLCHGRLHTHSLHHWAGAAQQTAQGRLPGGEHPGHRRPGDQMGGYRP